MVNKTENGNGKKEPVVFSVKNDLENGMKITVSGIATTDIEFMDKNPNSTTFRDRVKKKQYVLKVKINNVDGILPVNEGTALYSQIDRYVDDNDFTLPVKIMNEVFTVESGKGQFGEYYIFSELKRDYSNLFEDE